MKATTDLRAESLVGPQMPGPSDHEVAAAIQRYEDEKPSSGRGYRIRRKGPVVSALIDRLPGAPDSLADHLARQARLTVRPSRMLELVEWLIGNLDADGYLREDLGRLATPVGATVAEIEDALATVQSLEPVGVGARSLAECLLLQLRAQDELDTVAIRLVESHLRPLAEKRYADLARTLDHPVERIMRSLETIRRLEPRPARPFVDVPAQTICPDVTIAKTGDDYRVILGDDGIPDVRVSTRAWREAASQRGDARSYLAHDLRRAGWLITALERRRHTLRGIAHSIVRHQLAFLEHGPGRLRPLSFRQVAQELRVHESTVSRAVAYRYVDTPLGVFPLRFFFSDRLPADPEGAIAPAAARHRIREIVESEDPTCPLADGEIVRELAATGIRIARRTVVKYREVLGIPSIAARRERSA
jgi:RNA polymerase sigma-54 factor